MYIDIKHDIDISFDEHYFLQSLYTGLWENGLVMCIEGLVQNYCNYHILNNNLQYFCTKPLGHVFSQQ